MLGQIQQIDASLGSAVESYNLANVKLGRIQGDLRDNAYALHVARSNYSHAQSTLSRRLVTLYTSSDSGGTLEVLLGARSLDDLVNRIDTANRVSRQDSQVVEQVTAFRRDVQRHRRLLEQAQSAQKQVVAQRAAERVRIQGQLAQRKQLLSSIQGQIAQMKAAEAAQQARLQRLAQARLAAHPPVVQRTSSSSTVLGVAAATPEASVAPPSTHGGVVGIAMQFLGTPYVWGGASPGGFDCSGLVTYAFGQMGVSVPHSSYSQFGMGSPVSRDQLQPGDLVFFNGAGHVGIYIGGGQFIHAPHTGDVVKISSLSDSWYAATYDGARRL
ncbi:MAG: peptidoglycan DL-endopeptidase CwlO [Gaiellaceae bacterium]|nr:peptidoglycan DL-endopeptidase CwlO [Gaiellaceae bacterium]